MKEIFNTELVEETLLLNKKKKLKKSIFEYFIFIYMKVLYYFKCKLISIRFVY